MTCIGDFQCRGLNIRMTEEICSQQAAIPRPVVLGVCRGVNADKSSAGMNEVFECRLLRQIKDITSRVQKNDHSISRQICIGESCRIYGVVHIKTILHAQRSYRLNARWNGIVMKPCSFREHKHTKTWRSRCRCERGDENA